MLTFSSPKAGFITPGSSNGREYETLRQQRRAASVVDTLPDLDASLKEFRELLHSTIDVSLIHDMPMAFVTQPVLWQEDLAEVHQARCWMGNLGNTTYLSMAALRQAMDAYNHVLLDVCRERAVPCVDLAAMHGNVAYFYDDYHLTEEGAKQTAHLVAKDLSGWINETILSRRDGENTQNTNRGRR